MPVENVVRQETSPKPIKKKLKKPARAREVILAPDLYEAVLESIEQAKEGKVLSHEEVLQRNDL